MRRTSSQQEAITRRLELLSAELAAVRDHPDPEDDPPGQEPGAERQEAAAPDTPLPETAPRDGTPAEEAPVIPVPGRHAARRPGRIAGVRVGLAPGPMAVVAVMVAVGMALAAWWLVRDRPVPVPPLDPDVAPLVTPDATGLGAAAGVSTASPPSEVVVDVAGKVRRPGIVVLDPGARVVDALEAAGGPRKGVDLTGLNLARLLVDGEQLLVGVPPAPGTAGGTAPLGTGPAGTGAGTPGGQPLVDINTADLSELETLPGVGPVTAQAIVDWRTQNGGFRSVEQLLDVRGIGEATLADLVPHVTVG